MEIPMEETKCILCYNTQTVTTETISTSSIINLYKKRAGVAVEKYFQTPTIRQLTCKRCGLIFFWPQAVGDGQFYDELQKMNDYYLEEKAEFIEASKFVQETHDVLEIGCGEGLFAKRIRCKSFTGLEFSNDAIKKARAKGLTIFQESIQDHANKNGEKYDVVCFFQVLEHVSDPGDFLKASIKCLKPGGKLMVAVPSEDSFIKSVPNFYLNMPPHHATRWTDLTLKKLAELYPLKVERIFHESLHEAHKKFYLTTNIFRKLGGLFGRPVKTIDTGLGGLFLYATSVLISYITSPFLSGKANIQGQSVLVVFQKNERTSN